MIYIHSLKDLNPKTADIEAVQIIRDLKNKITFPTDDMQLRQVMESLFPSMTDKKYIEDAENALKQLSIELNAMACDGDSLYEPVNITRAQKMVGMLKIPMINQAEYAANVASGWGSICREFAYLINTLSKGNPREYNDRLNTVFAILLRSDDFMFNYSGVISEAELKTALDMHESFENGFLFHIKLEEEVQKFTFAQIKSRIPSEALEHNEKLTRLAQDMEKGVKRWYEHNLRMIEVAITLYAVLKMAQEKQAA